MKLFHFYRVKDQTGVSGTGPVVEGVQFTNGWCALRWMSGHSSLGFYQTLEDVRAIHGHGGDTEIVIHDFEPLNKRPSMKEEKSFEILLEVIEETSRIITLEEGDLGGQGLHLKSALDRIRRLLDQLEKANPAKFKASA